MQRLSISATHQTDDRQAQAQSELGPERVSRQRSCDALPLLHRQKSLLGQRGARHRRSPCRKGLNPPHFADSRRCWMGPCCKRATCLMKQRRSSVTCRRGEGGTRTSGRQSMMVQYNVSPLIADGHYVHGILKLWPVAVRCTSMLCLLLEGAD